MLDTILFDLDGTLVPFMQDEFIQTYFKALVKRVAPYGYDGEQVIAALWKGTGAMLKNTGERSNRQVFWERFVGMLGEKAAALEEILDEFYTREFDAVRVILQEERNLKGMIGNLREKGYRVVLATNPIFPAVSVATRMSWVGLSPEDFDYVTTYENSRYSKPNPDYYRYILTEIGARADQCLMIGNNPVDDGAAMEVGIETRIVTDYLENEKNLRLDPFPVCTFRELERKLSALPAIQ